MLLFEMFENVIYEFKLKKDYSSNNYQLLKIEADKIEVIEIINCTINHDNGTNNTQIINLGKACFNSHFSHLPIIFINAITIIKIAKMKYTTFETKIHNSFI
jgi:hypothetical protein